MKSGNYVDPFSYGKCQEINLGITNAHQLTPRCKRGVGGAEAKADCNILHFGYKIRNELQVRLEEGVSTRMACPGHLEEDFIQVLMETDNLASDGQTLSLNKGRMAPLARFILVEGTPGHSGE